MGAGVGRGAAYTTGIAISSSRSLAGPVVMSARDSRVMSNTPAAIRRTCSALRDRLPGARRFRNLLLFVPRFVHILSM